MTKKIFARKRLCVFFAVVAMLLCMPIFLTSCQNNDNAQLPTSPNTETPTNGTDEPDGEVTVTKKSSHDVVRTVHPGENITYTYTIYNSSSKKQNVSITESVPTYTTYVSGDAEIVENKLTMNVEVLAGKKVDVSYEVKASTNKADFGKYVSDSATVNEKTVSCEDILIGYTLNETDQEKIVKSIMALMNSKFEGIDLIKYLYRIAFTETPVVKEAPSVVLNHIFVPTDTEKTATYTSIVVPSLWGGKCVTDSMGVLLPGDKTVVTLSDVLIGDIICVQFDANDENSGRFYVTDGNRLYDITGRCKVVDTTEISELATADYYAVLRPSLGLVSDTGIRSKPLLKGETEIEQAIIATAEAFLLRGDRLQYADTHLFNSNNDEDDEYRWERGQAPEDCTLDELGYNNCSGFAHDVILNALGFDYGNAKLKDFPAASKEYVYTLTGNETQAQIDSIAEEYKSRLKIGDIIYYPYVNSNSSHVLVYIGNGNIVHCTGNNYSADNYKEYEEPGIRYLNVDNLFDPTSARYVFQTDKKREALYIIRPMNLWTGDSISSSAQQRINGMNGIVAEKLCSSTLGQTVNPGDTLTYTFKIFNTTTKIASLNITDLVPDGCTLLINGEPSEDKILYLTIELNPYEEKNISYTVRVSQSFPVGQAILCNDESKVGGIPVKTPPVYVGRTLTTAEQARLCEIANGYVGSSLSAIALANAIYKDLLDVDNILSTSLASLSAGLFLANGDYKSIATEGNFASMIAPSLYGGKKVMNSTRFLGERTRMPRENNLIVGDILFLQGRTSSTYSLCVYMGDGVMLNLAKGLNATYTLKNRLENTIGWQHFCVLRPSLSIV